MVQFKEHESGKQQTDPRIQKLDKLARLLKVHMQVDGVSYGAIPENQPKQPTNVVAEYVETVTKPVDEPTNSVDDSTPTTVDDVVTEDVVTEDVVVEETKKVVAKKPPTSKPKTTKTTKTS